MGAGAQGTSREVTSMSWEGTYSHTVAIATAQFAAAVLLNRSDITVSSLCRVVQLADAGIEDFPDRLRALEFSDRQIRALRWIGRKLEEHWPGHCEEARKGDLLRYAAVGSLLHLAAESSS